MLALAAAATIACAAALALDPEHAFVATLVVAALVLCVGGYALMLYFRAKVQRYKKAQEMCIRDSGRGHRRVRYPLRRVAAQFNLRKTGQVTLPIIEKLAELLGQLRGR